MLSRRRYVTEDEAAPATYVAPSVVAVPSTPWSPAQFIAMIVGVGFAVLGIVAVVRTGFDTSHIYTPRTFVWHLPHTPLLAAIEIGYGALMVLTAVVPGGLRTLMGLLGATALVLGIVVLAGSSHRLNHWLAVNHSSGVLFTIAGASVVVASIISPVFFNTNSRRAMTYN